MNTRFTAYTAAAATALLVSSTTLAQRPIPQQTFVCHVMTEHRVEGVALIQGSSREDASRAARAAMAWETPETSGEVVDVIECVPHPTERLGNRAMRELLASLPL